MSFSFVQFQHKDGPDLMRLILQHCPVNAAAPVAAQGSAAGSPLSRSDAACAVMHSALAERGGNHIWQTAVWRTTCARAHSQSQGRRR